MAHTGDGINIGEGPILMKDMDPLYTRKFIAVIIDPALREVTLTQYGVHVEGMSDDLERLQKAVDERLRKEFPDGKIAYYKRIDEEEAT